MIFWGHFSSVSITELYKGFTARIFIRLTNVSGLRDPLNLAARVDSSEKVVKTNDEGDRVLVVMRKSNLKGRVVEFLSIQEW